VGGGEREENCIQDFGGETGRKIRLGFYDVITVGHKEMG